MAKTREKDAEAALDAKIRKIREQNQLREQREREVERDRELARAAGSDEARLSKCVRYRSGRSPEDDAAGRGRPQPAGSPNTGSGRSFLRDPARDGRPSGRPERPALSAQQRRQEEAWRRERLAVDQSRLERARDADGGWRREWDRQKEPAELAREETRARRAGRPAADLSQRPEPAAGGGAGPGQVSADVPDDGQLPADRRESYSVELAEAIFTYSCSYIG